MNNNEISGAVVDSAMKVHTALGPGLLESAYQVCLMHELAKRGLKVNYEVPLPVVYDTVRLDVGYRLDLVVEDTVIVEIKAVERLAPITPSTTSLLFENKWQTNRASDQLSLTAFERWHQTTCKLTSVFLGVLCGEIALCVE